MIGDLRSNDGNDEVLALALLLAAAGLTRTQLKSIEPAHHKPLLEPQGLNLAEMHGYLMPRQESAVRPQGIPVDE